MNPLSRQVFKYSIDYIAGPGPRTLSVPVQSRFLDAQEQHGQLVLWFLVNDDNPTEIRDFYLLETGKEFPESGWHYLRTVQLAKGDYVIHLLTKHRKKEQEL